MELRVTRPARAVAKGRCDEPVSLDELRARMTAAHSAGIRFEIADRRVDGSVVCRNDPLRGVAIGKRPGDRDALWRRERQVEAGERRDRLTERSIAPRVASGKHRSEVVPFDDAREAEFPGKPSGPTARSLAGIEVVVLSTLEDLGEVVRLLVLREPANAHHERPASLLAKPEVTSRTLVPVCVLLLAGLLPWCISLAVSSISGDYGV